MNKTKHLLKDFKGYYSGLIIGPFFKLSEAVMELFVPIIMANIIDKGIIKGDKAYIIQNGLLLLLIGALGFAFALICQYSASHVAHGYGKALRARLFRHVFSLTESDCSRIGASALITRLTNDVNQVQTGVNMFIRLAIRAPYLAIGSVIMALIVDWKLGLIFLISTPLILLVLYLITKISVPFYTNIQKKQDVISKLVSEMILGSRVIRAFSRQGLEQQQFDEAGDDLAVITIKVGKLSALLNPLTTVITNIAIVAIVWFGAGFAFSGNIEPGKILALVNYMTQTLLALIVLSNILVLFSKAIASAKRLEEVLENKPEFACENIYKASQKSDTAVEFKNVSFSYTKSEPALSDISLMVKNGETLGVIGGTGCGKTTIARLILHLFEACKGDVLVNGKRVQGYSEKALSDMISYVPQGAALFSGTIRENLSLASTNLSDAQLWQALEIAQGADFVKKIDGGLDALLTEGGKNLSGGQKQRLCIARALTAGSFNILILDDASSALDYATDAALRRGLRQSLEDKTIIMITQRAASIIHADKILVLDDGEQVGFGTHSQLIENCEVYKEICASQGILKEAAK